MEKINYQISIPLPKSLAGFIRALKFKADKTKKNLLGDRDVEWAFVAANLPDGKGFALDVGCGGSYLALMAAQKGYHVIATDLQTVHWYYQHPHLEFVKGDLLELPLPENHMDLIINCSATEHVGIAGRYGVEQTNPDGDLKLMKKLLVLLKPKGQMILTIPVGQDELFKPLCRVYGSKRLPLLLQGFNVVKEEYWAKNGQNQWVVGSRDKVLAGKANAGSWNAEKNIYGLGCFVLRKNG